MAAKPVFSQLGVDRCPRICPQPAHTAPTGPVWGSTGVVPLFGSQNRTQGRTRAFSLFPSTCSTFPLRGKVGLNSHPSCSARPNSSTTAPHGFNGAGNPSYWCRFPTRPTKPHTGPSLVFTVFFWYALDLAGLTSHSPACNSPHPGWVGW